MNVQPGSRDGEVAELLERIRRSPVANEKIGELHTSGDFLHLIRDPQTGEFLSPSYVTLEDQIIDWFNRRAELRSFVGEAADDDDFRLMHFLPYPPLPIPFRMFNSNRVAVIDSGVLTDHPLLQGAIVDMQDFTGEGIEDLNGHGTIQAIRQRWVEPFAELIILKAFSGKDGQPSLLSIAGALEYLFEQEVGYIFMAGGVDVNKYPDGELICRLATKLAEAKGLLGTFVATTGNIGDKGHWCPAEADQVWSVAVLDKDTLDSATGGRGHTAILQKGEFVSFPDIHPLRLGEFYYKYADIFRGRGYAPLAKDFAERAAAYEYARLPALRLSAALASDAGDFGGAVGLLREALAMAPADARLNTDLAIALMKLGEDAEAGKSFEAALALDGTSVFLRKEYAKFCETRLKDTNKALAQFIEAARLDVSAVGELIEFGGRVAYDSEYAISIEANRQVLALDPTFAAGFYNIAVCHALAGDDVSAKDWLRLYAENKSPLDTSLSRYDPAATAALIESADMIEKMASLEYSFDGDREFAAEYELLRGLVREDPPARRGRFAALAPARRARLLEAAARCADRLLLLERCEEHDALASVLQACCDETAEGAENVAPLPEALLHLGRLYHRLGEFARAVKSFDEAQRLWSSISARKREVALVEKGFSEIANGDYASARESFVEAESKSVKIKNTEDFKVVQTSEIPRCYDGLAYLSLRRQDFGKAREQLENAYNGDHGSLETLLLTLQVAAHDLDEQAVNELLAQAIKLASRSERGCSRALRLLEDHPLYNFTLDVGHTVHDYMKEMFEWFRERRVALSPAAVFPLERLYDAATGRFAFADGECAGTAGVVGQPAQKIAIVGTGLLSEHPCLKRHIIASVDFTGEGLEDLNGGSSFQAIQTLEAKYTIAKQMGMATSPPGLISVKVQDRQGRGSVRNLIRGLLYAKQSGAQLALIAAHVGFEDRHLMGILGHVGKHTNLIVNA
jgi:tetratricopeptide (TPR) repeat protein